MKALLVATLVLAAPPSSGEMLDAQIKAAYLANFTRYIAWPSGSRQQMCLVGADEIAGWLERGKGTPPVRRLTEPDEIAGCSLLFLGRDSTQTRQWLAAAQNKAILTVGEQGGFLQRGGIINLVVRNNTLRFEVSLDNAQRSHLAFSSRLLVLAEHVEGSVP